MKYKKLTFVIAAVLFATAAHGQIKVESNGRVIVGPNNLSNFDLGEKLAMSIQGRNANCNNCGAKLGFGDFGQFVNNGWNVFVGEYGEEDSDVLWLHGKRGIMLTMDNGSTVVCEYSEDRGMGMVFRQPMRANRLSLYSNDENKSDIQTVDNALDRLLQLSCISYRYVVPRNYTLTTEARSMSGGTETDVRTACTTDKERADSARMVRRDSVRAVGSSSLGFLTSEIERLFPELVETDGEGNKYVDYMGLVSVIVAALGEQQNALEYMSAQLQECCSANVSSDSEDNPGAGAAKGGSNQQVGGKDGEATLYQNSPNPFSRATEIRYYVPKGTREATIYVFTLNGILEQTHNVTSGGSGSVTIDASTLSAGMYVYSLVVDGRIVDSKRMILTN